MSSPVRGSPAPMRATQASQRRSHRKLIKPFRSPIMAKAPSNSSCTVDVHNPVPVLPQSTLSSASSMLAKDTPMVTHDTPNVMRTMTTLALSSKAASQFRSPLVGATSDSSRVVILPTATIQNLERKLAVLHRAVKIKEADDNLEGLARKWREAGRETAYELWSIVRDMKEDNGSKSGNGDWGGWDDKDDGGEKRAEAERSGVDVVAAEEEVEEVQETLGLMLRRLGIAPETLGWDDAEERFVDD
ncbi:hypothetical protein FA95DRAFT_1566179 [Auriscalpium vulgare]|uniref:Uncharacterized protein n=1 Tax=Auriscalpium vulgare TaxID=40419 RepID=A0ACB8RAR9_9AGAM|nr:hypothetical protein FA95DRAFT_1566179 [Auriscalpium vulgare]